MCQSLIIGDKYYSYYKNPRIQFINPMANTSELLIWGDVPPTGFKNWGSTGWIRRETLGNFQDFSQLPLAFKFGRKWRVNNSQVAYGYVPAKSFSTSGVFFDVPKTALGIFSLKILNRLYIVTTEFSSLIVMKERIPLRSPFILFQDKTLSSL